MAISITINDGIEDTSLAINEVSLPLKALKAFPAVSSIKEYRLSSIPGSILFKNGNLPFRFSTASNALEIKLFSWDRLSSMLLVISPSCLIP